VVGGSGVIVNLITLVVLRRIGPHFDDAVVGLGSSGFNLRWYHVFSTVAFLVANLSNFQLNRSWTFRSSRVSGWWHEYWPFLAVGFGGQVVGLAMLTLLMHPHSPVSLPTDVFDDSSGLRNRLYWSQLIVIALVMPVSFVFNKLWTFAAVRTGRLDLADPLFEEDLRVGPHP
jgi:putative flippase GtrA